MSRTSEEVPETIRDHQKLAHFLEPWEQAHSKNPGQGTWNNI